MVTLTKGIKIPRCTLGLLDPALPPGRNRPPPKAGKGVKFNNLTGNSADFGNGYFGEGFLRIRNEVLLE
jgi:hypothetical protein